MRRIVPLLLSLGIVAGLVCLPTGAQQSMMQQVAIEQEDDRLFMDMRRVSDWLNQYCVWNHRFPEQGDQMRQAKAQLNQLTPNNPYANDKLTLSQGLDADPEYGDPNTAPTNALDYQQASWPVPSDQAADYQRIQLQIDPSLTELELQQYQTDPPDEWTAAPGTISCISNQQNLFCVWGAGRDGRPIRDPLSHRVQIVVGRYAMLNFGE